MGMQRLSPNSVTAGSGLAGETIEVFTRRGAGDRWEFCDEAEVPAAVADLTVWLSQWLADNHIGEGQWLAGNKWSGQDSAILTAAPGLTVAA